MGTVDKNEIQKKIVEKFGTTDVNGIYDSDFKTFILPDGKCLDLTAGGNYDESSVLHDDVVDWAVANNLMGPQSRDDYFGFVRDVLGWVRVNGGMYFIDLPSGLVTDNQYDTLKEILEYIFDEEETLEVNVKNKYKEYSFSDYSINQIINKIKRYYSLGSLTESNNSKVTEQDILDAIEKMGEEDGISYINGDAVNEEVPTIFITPSGVIIDVEGYDTHAEFMEAVYGYLNNAETGMWIYDYVVEALGFITLNTGYGYGENRCKVIIGATPTNKQYSIVREWLEKRISTGTQNPIIVYVNEVQKTFWPDHNNYSAGGIIKSIQKSFVGGILEKLWLQR